MTSHSSCLWNVAKSLDALDSKGTRFGTYDSDLNYVGP